MKTTPLRALGFTVLISLAGMVACGNSPTSPGIEPEIVGTASSFSYQVSDIENFTGSADFTWSNSGTSVNVDLSSAGGSGSATLVLLDAAGEVVYSGSLTQDGSFPSSSGAAGDWTIRVIYESFTGTVNFRVDTET